MDGNEEAVRAPQLGQKSNPSLEGTEIPGPLTWLALPTPFSTSSELGGRAERTSVCFLPFSFCSQGLSKEHHDQAALMLERCSSRGPWFCTPFPPLLPPKAQIHLLV